MAIDSSVLLVEGDNAQEEPTDGSFPKRRAQPQIAQMQSAVYSRSTHVMWPLYYTTYCYYPLHTIDTIHIQRLRQQHSKLLSSSPP